MERSSSRRRASLPGRRNRYTVPDRPSHHPQTDACSFSLAPPAEDTPSQQQAVLESLASYLEGELMSRMQSYSELLAEIDAIHRERSFYHTKLLQIEKVCKHAQPYTKNIPKWDQIMSILSTSDDMPFA